jgi:hypothetical protein
MVTNQRVALIYAFGARCIQTFEWKLGSNLFRETPIPKAKPGGCRAQHVGIGKLNNPAKRRE